jgi:hypothetical protein
MGITSRRMAILSGACILLVLVTSSLGGVAEAAYISGLGISLEDVPDVVSVGETFSMKINVTNNSGQAVSGRLRTYLYASINEVTYPLPDEGFEWVPVCEGDWIPNEIYVSLDADETEATYNFTLTVRSDLQFAGGATAQARLRARFRETGANVAIAPDSDKEIVLRHETTSWSVEIPPMLALIIVVLAALAVLAVVVYLLMRGRETETSPELKEW